MLNEMGLYVIINEKDSKIQLWENHEVITNFISINNLYFLNIVEDPLIQTSAVAIKKSNYR